jgi:MATE family multidrug resistance protein
LALPVSLAQLALVGMTATDVLIAGNASTIDLAGMNLGANSWNMIAVFFMGIGFATQPLVAHYFGARDLSAVKHQMQQSIWLCLGLGVVCVFCVWLIAWLLLLLNFEKNMLDIAHRYLLVMSLCAIPFCVQPALRGTLEGMNQTFVVFVINFTAFLLNIPLDYVLVNGLYGFPKLGGVGCAWATVLLVWMMVFAMWFVLVKKPQMKQLQLFADFQWPARAAILKTWELGLPIGIAIVIELSMFCGAGVLIASFGPVQAGAHAVAITIAAMSFMLYNGLAQGITIRSAQFLGAMRPERALYSVKSGIAFNLFIALLICLLFLIFAEQLVRLFSSDPAVIELAVVLLYFGAAFQIGDCLQVSVVYALRAYHDTVTPPKVMFIGFWLVGLPLGTWLAFNSQWSVLEGAKGLWFGMVGSLFLVGLLLLRQLGLMISQFAKGRIEADPDEVIA